MQEGKELQQINSINEGRLSRFDVNRSSTKNIPKMQHETGFRGSIMIKDIQLSDNFGKWSYRYNDLPGISGGNSESSQMGIHEESESVPFETKKNTGENDTTVQIVHWAKLLISVICASALSPLMICQPEPILYKLFWQSVLVF